MKLTDPRLTTTIALCALSVWIGGLLSLGAVAAPLVFGMVPLPLAADTMALVFARFDKVAMSAAAIILATEAVRVRSGGPLGSGQLARVLVSVALAGSAVLEGLWVTPTIAGLHAAGAVRGVGEAGQSLASAHALAESIGKAQALLAIALIALHVWTLTRVSTSPSDAPAPVRSSGREGAAEPRRS